MSLGATGHSMHILFHRSTPWDSEIQCSTKTYASLFHSFGHSVTYLQDLIHPGHYLLRRGYYHTWKQGARFEDGVWVASGCSWLPAFKKISRYHPTLAAWNYRGCRPSLASIVERSGQGTPDIIWSTKPGSAELKSIFPGSRLVMNVVDYYPAFHGPAIQRLERHDYQMADHVFVIGHTLRRYLEEDLGIEASKITVLGQGVDIQRYQQPCPEPADLQDIPGPRAVWVGVLKKADQELMETAAAELAVQGGSLVLIGPPGDWEQSSMSRHDNIQFLGPKPTAEIPAYLLNCQIGLMLYDRQRQDVYRGQNPLKLYEYLAAGLYVLSTPHDEFEFLKPPIEVVQSSQQVRKTLAAIPADRSSHRDRMQAFAKQLSWESVGRRAESILQSLTEARP